MAFIRRIHSFNTSWLTASLCQPCVWNAVLSKSRSGLHSHWTHTHSVEDADYNHMWLTILLNTWKERELTLYGWVIMRFDLGMKSLEKPWSKMILQNINRLFLLDFICEALFIELSRLKYVSLLVCVFLCFVLFYWPFIWQRPNLILFSTIWSFLKTSFLEIQS